MAKKAAEYYVSFDNEHFEEGPFSSVAEAVKAIPYMVEGTDQTSYQIGKRKEYVFPGVNIDFIFEDLSNSAMADGCGEYSEGWPELTGEQESDLEGEINKVVLKHLKKAKQWPPSFFMIETVTVGTIQPTKSTVS